MCETFEFNNFSVISSLCERNIYIKFTDNINFTTYESTLDQKELRLNFALPEIYKIMKKCFQKEEHYNVEVIANSNLLRLIFTALVGGILSINFEVQLREKIMSNDAQLTTSFNKMEQKCTYLTRRIDELQQTLEQCQTENRLMIEALSNAEICLGIRDQNNYILYIHNISLNVVQLEVNSTTNWTTIYWSKFKLLFNLKKIKFSDINIDFQTFLSTSLEEIEIIGSQTPSLSGIEKNKKIKKITLNGLINLSHTNFMPYIKECKNLKHLIIKSCGQINVVEIQTYCQTNRIQLDIS
jgi:hypothetical protein